MEADRPKTTHRPIFSVGRPTPAIKEGPLFKDKLNVFRELLSFLWKEKAFWLIPLVVVLVGLGVLLFLAQGSALAPFIYTLF